MIQHVVGRSPDRHTFAGKVSRDAPPWSGDRATTVYLSQVLAMGTDRWLVGERVNKTER
jgi:hypothetical protein